MKRAKTCIRLKAGTTFDQVARTPLIKLYVKYGFVLNIVSLYRFN